MSQPVISVEGLGKRYTLHHQARSGLLRDQLAGLLRNPFGRAKTADAANEDFWALRDVNFSVNQGDVVGIIGRNGAGKSTLLKILSRITEPTTGRITIHGRIASLLEVGTGFHGELSGRENIFLNGAILGMKRAEIRKKFDEIVAFSEVEKFLDTPVKHYSSGMYVRLAFAVAAHLEPEILIVDEVLAVGDQEFQKKCLGKMQEVASGQGRTVLFVSHNLASIRQLCTRAVVLQSGCLICDDTVQVATTHYSRRSRDGAPAGGYRHKAGDGRGRVTHIELVSARDGQSVLSVFELAKIHLDYETDPSVSAIEGFVLIYSEDGECLAASFQRDRGGVQANTARRRGRLTVCFENPLAPGRYLISAGLFDQSRQFLDWVEFAEGFEVNDGFADGRAFDNRLGRYNLSANWEDCAL